MNNKVLTVWCLAVLVLIGVAAVFFGAEAVRSIGEGCENVNKKDFCKISQNNNFAIAKTERLVLGKAIMSTNPRNKKDLPFLVNGIKYKNVYRDGFIVYYISNQYLVYDVSADRCVYFLYNCKIGKPRLTESQCMDIAKKSCIQCGHKSVKRAVRVYKCPEGKYYTFLIEWEGRCEADAFISVRSDTGSVIYYRCGDSFL